MPHLYKQSTGEWFWNGKRLGVGYAGAGQGKNNPDMQGVKGIGPLPQGFYTILEPQDTETHGPFAMPLIPDEGNEMFGRSGFMCHGDSIKHPGTASEGCIIQYRVTRGDIWDSGDRRLEVIT